MKKLIFFILLMVAPALANAAIEINYVTTGEIIVLQTEVTYTDGTNCKIVGVDVPRFNVQKVEIQCFQPVVDGGGGGGDTTTNTDNHTEDNDTTYNEDNDTTYYEDNDSFNFEENNIDNSTTNTKQNGATVTVNH